VPSVIVRPPVVYGPGDTVNLPPLLKMAKLGLFVKPGFRPKYYSFIHVDDLCEAIYAAGTTGKTLSSEDPTQGVYFVSDPTIYSYEQFCQALSSAVGKSHPTVIPLPDTVGHLVGAAVEFGGKLIGANPIMNRDKAHEMGFEAWTCRPDRAAKEIHFEAKFAPLEAGLVSAVAWYRKEGML
jgi:dihydroflavonol-4-reductase